MRTKIAAKWTS